LVAIQVKPLKSTLKIKWFQLHNSNVDVQLIGSYVEDMLIIV